MHGISACLSLIIMKTGELVAVSGCLRFFTMEASLILEVILVEMEVSNDSATAQVLTLTVVAIAEVSEPDLLECLKMIPPDGEDLLVNDPVDDVGAGGIRQRALVVIEGVHLEGGGSHQSLSLIREFLLDTTDLGRSKSVKHLCKVDLLDQPEIKGAQFLYEGVAVICFFEEHSNDCKCLFVILPASGTVDQLMHDVNF